MSAAIPVRRIAPLLACGFVLLSAGGLHFTLTPTQGQRLGFGEFQLGVIGAAYYAGFLAGSIANPTLFRLLGHRALFIGSAAILCASVAGQAILSGVAAWTALRFAIGWLAAGMFAAIESWLHALATNENRGRTLSLYVMSNQGALALSQLLFTLTPTGDLSGFLWSAGIAACTVLPMLAMRGAAPPRPAKARTKLSALYRASPVAFVGFAANGVATSPIWVLGPAFAADHGLGHEAIGLFMSLPIFGLLLSQWPIARLSDRMDRRLVIGPVAAAGAGAAALVAASPWIGGAWAMFAGAFLFGATAWTVGMLCGSHLNDRVKPEEMTDAAGASFLVYGAFSVIGPLTASALVRLMGSEALYVQSAAVLAAFAAFVVYRMSARAAARRAAA